MPIHSSHSDYCSSSDASHSGVLVLCGLAAAVIPVSGQVCARVGTRFEARIVSIVDGDTVDAVPLGSKGTIRIRLHGVDAPNVASRSAAPQPGPRASCSSISASASTGATSIAIADWSLVFMFGERTPARTAHGGPGMSLRCVLSDVTLANAEADARRHGRLLGSGYRETAVHDHAAAGDRTQIPGDGPVVFHGNTSSRVYHSRSCPNYKCRNCTQAFHSEAEARAEDFRWLATAFPTLAPADKPVHTTLQPRLL